MSGATAFQPNAFENDAFQITAAATNFVTDTAILQLPINCVVAGQQKEPVKNAMGLNGAISGPLRGIFNE